MLATSKHKISADEYLYFFNYKIKNLKKLYRKDKW